MTFSCPVSQARPYPFSTFDGIALDPLYSHLREHEPVSRVRMPYGGEAWFLTRHADVKAVLGDQRFSMEAGAGRDVPRPTEYPLPAGGLISMDPPEHSRLRRLTGQAFTARRVEELRPQVSRFTHELLDEMVARDEPSGEIMEDLALPVSISVICKLLGVSYDDRHRFRAFSEALVSSSLSPAEVQQATEDFTAYMAVLVADRRARPTDDFLSTLVQARDEGDRLSEAELLMIGSGLLISGYETTATQIGNFVHILLSDRRLYDSLVADPGLVPAAVEELLRFTPLSTMDGFARIALEDVEIGGTLIRAGEAVITSIASANFDATAFPGAEYLDFTRPQNPHLGFGHGVHYCMGAPLARLELQAVLSTLVERLPGLRLSVPAGELRWRTGSLLRTPEAVPVTWDDPAE
ncbi:cytochrome P450 [Streptomyces sp. SID5643]|uniref:cytochrome P450 n=1 Tax=Streptomyces sp. SID5643 TaxID=2690307 RepID=UPI00136E85D5|nr:cytochrome P450 [Streptomyces sp. SID5643]MZF85330.1 cytochrome P450 [Streptomyces sp. SID5643]